MLTTKIMGVALKKGKEFFFFFLYKIINVKISKQYFL